MIKLDEEEKQAKSDEDIFSIPENHLNIKDTYEKKDLPSKWKDLLPLLHIVNGLLVIIVGIVAVLSWINMSALNAEITELRAKMNSIDNAGLKSQLTAVESKLENIKKDNDKFRADASQNSNELHTLKVKIEKIEAAAQKQQPAAKKKPSDKPQKIKQIR